MVMEVQPFGKNPGTKNFKRNSNVYVFDTFERYDGIVPGTQPEKRIKECQR